MTEARAPKNVRRRTRPASPGGFTLVELLAVLAVLGILSATAIPALSALAGTRAAAAQRLVRRDLTLAREHAVATGAAHRVAFDLTVQTVATDRSGTGKPDASAWSALPVPGSGRATVRQLGTGELAGVALTAADFGGTPGVAFDWSGRPFSLTGAALTADGSVTLTGGRVVTVRRGTGLAEIGP